MNFFVKQLNADAQEASGAAEATETAATTNVPVEATETVVEAAVEVVAAKPIVEEVVVTAHDDFDWSVDKRNVAHYSQEEKEKYDHVYENTFVKIADGEILNGDIVGLTKTDAVINIGFKSDGLISLNEFRDLQGVQVGDVVEVMVVEKEDRQGNLHLSRKSARIFRAWERIMEVHKTGEVVTGLVTSKTKGGLIVDVFGMETFLPGSQIDVKPVTDYDQFVGKTMEFKVVKINETIKNAVVSHKALIESDIEAQRAEIMSKLEKGQVLEGTVKNITDFGAFMDLGGLDGLLYITDISWGRISHPSEVLKMDQKINVVVLDFDDDKKRISLGLKQLTPHPWEALDTALEIGSKVKGRIVTVADYGAFLEITPGVEGLIHVSEMSWSQNLRNPQEFLKVGDEVEAQVLTLDRNERKMSLGIKQLTPDPWKNIGERYPIGSKHKAVVKNMTNFGVFVEIEEGIDGLIHISDLSWSKKVNHPNEFTKVGEELDVVVLELDEANRKLSLGHKQLEENPWETFETVFTLDSIHEGTVLKVTDKGAIIALPYGVEGFTPTKHMVKEDGSSVKAEETAEFRIIEFNKDSKRIVVSHARIWEEAKAEERKEEFNAKKKEAKATTTAVKKVKESVEKSTLGDLGVLAQLKEKMEGAESKAKKAKKTEEDAAASTEVAEASEEKAE